MYPWQDFDIKASYDGKVTVQVLDADQYGYTVKYKDEIFKVPRNTIKILRKK